METEGAKMVAYNEKSDERNAASGSMVAAGSSRLPARANGHRAIRCVIAPAHRPFVKPRSSLLFSPYDQQPPLGSLLIARGREFIRSRRDVDSWHDLSSNLTYLYTLYGCRVIRVPRRFRPLILTDSSFVRTFV